MSGSNVVTLCDSVGRAVSRTFTATDTFILIDSEGDESLTNACGASLIYYMFDIFISEVTKSGDDGVWSRLTESAEGRRFDIIAELLEAVEVFHLALTRCYLIEYFKQASCADTAGGTLTA